jgi:FkbM family methyltransferase
VNRRARWIVLCRAFSSTAIAYVLRSRAGSLFERILVRMGHLLPSGAPGSGVIRDRLLDRHRGETLVATLFDGSELCVPAIREGFTLYFHGRCFGEDKALTRLLVNSVSPGETFFDIGANLGYYSVLVAARRANVHAFEAQPLLAALIRKSISRLPDAKVARVVHAAVADRHGVTTRLFFPEDKEQLIGVASLLQHEWLEGGTSETVPVITIDEYMRENDLSRVDVIKLDIEGSELFALQGMHALLEERPPRLILAELWPAVIRFESIGSGCALRPNAKAMSASTIANHLAQFGYFAHRITSRGEIGARYSAGDLHDLALPANAAFVRV